MKLRFLFCFIICMFRMTVWSQTPSEDYHPFAEKDKGWETCLGETPESVYDNRIVGDTLINGERWHKVYNTTGWAVFDDCYYVAVRDVGKKVYAIAKGSNRPRLLYDFDLKVGNILRCGVEGNAFGCLLDSDEQPDTLLGFEFRAYLRVESIDTVSVNGTERRRFKLTMLDAFKYDFTAEEDGGERGNIVWIEGVGSGAGPFLPWIPLPPRREIPLIGINCTVGKSSICFTKDFYDNQQEPAAVRTTKHKATMRDCFYDLQGRRLIQKLQRGVYIQQGRKVMVR